MTLPSTGVLVAGLRLRHPVIAAPMAGVTTPELAAAVTSAGGLGVLAFAGLTVDEMRAQMERARAYAEGPLGVNLFVNPDPVRDVTRERAAADAIAPLYREVGLGDPPRLSQPPTAFTPATLELLLEIRPELVSFHFGLPIRAHVERLRAVGARVATTANSVAEAIAAVAGGADVVIAQGAEAGGHRGTTDPTSEPVGTLALVPQVVDAVDVPVVAAGGIGDGRGVAAVRALGAVAAQVGTAFIACPESAADEQYREAVRATAGEETALTSAFTGRPARGLRNRVPERLVEGAPRAAFPLQRQLSGPLSEHGVEYRALWMGQAASLARTEPAADVTERLGRDAAETLGRLGAGV